MVISGYLVLKWMHILALTYWLGGEWGVFQTAFHILNPHLSLEERRHHLETAYRIDILARLGILLLLPLGFQMGAEIGVNPFGAWVVPVWIFMLLWMSLTFSAFLTRGTPLGLKLTLWDEKIRYVIIPLLFGTALWSLITGGPLTAHWYAAKVLIYSLLLVIGLLLRFVMRHWGVIFRTLAETGATPALEQQLAHEGALSRKLAYVYWVGIASVAFIGVVKPF
jgi:hypothetical protein